MANMEPDDYDALCDALARRRRALAALNKARGQLTTAQCTGWTLMQKLAHLQPLKDRYADANGEVEAIIHRVPEHSYRADNPQSPSVHSGPKQEGQR